MTATKPPPAMTTEEAFQSHLDQHPDDHNARLVFADWLDEQNDPRAAGYRALGRLRKYPMDSSAREDWWWWSQTNEPLEFHNTLPMAWVYRMREIRRERGLRKHLVEDRAYPSPGTRKMSRRKVEDVAALAYRPEFEVQS